MSFSFMRFWDVFEIARMARSAESRAVAAGLLVSMSKSLPYEESIDGDMMTLLEDLALILMRGEALPDTPSNVVDDCRSRSHAVAELKRANETIDSLESKVNGLQWTIRDMEKQANKLQQESLAYIPWPAHSYEKLDECLKVLRAQFGDCKWDGKIQAIKDFRSVFGGGLKEMKDLAEKFLLTDEDDPRKLKLRSTLDG